VNTRRNRKEDHLTAIVCCLGESVPLEVLVYDDASTDGTSAAILERFPPHRFPQVRLFTQPAPVGYIVLRNMGAQAARANIIFSIDDDAIFTTPIVAETVLAEFSHPRVGAVAIPFQNIRIGPEVFQRSPDPHEVMICASYIGTAHAVRRDLFLQLGGYREALVHQGEESDYCIRLLAAGYVVRLGASETIHHFVSPKRDMRRLHYYGTRNNILFACFNIAGGQLPLHLAGTTIRTLLHAVKVGALGIKLKAVFDGYRDGLRHRALRRPVPPAILKLFRLLRQRPMALKDVESRLIPCAAP
jgi:GT2 family glycosyltransferase